MGVLSPGTQLKRGTFIIASELGRGGFGEVYVARQPRMDRDVAIKVLLPRVADDPRAVERFQREALAAGALLHPNVLPVFDFDFDEDAGVWYLAMQYVPGGRTLGSNVQLSREVAEVGRLVEAVGGALDAAHGRGIVHRDIKPANVLLDGDRPLLTDFGIAHLGDMTAMTSVGMAIGTPAYMSPEQAMGRPVGPQSDQYSLAIVAYELLAGRPPFVGDLLSIVAQQVNAPPPPLRELNPRVGADTQAVIERALRKAPTERYSSCSEFASALLASAGVPSAERAALGQSPAADRMGRASRSEPDVDLTEAYQTAGKAQLTLVGPDDVTARSNRANSRNGVAAAKPPERHAAGGRLTLLAAAAGMVVVLAAGALGASRLMPLLAPLPQAAPSNDTSLAPGPGPTAPSATDAPTAAPRPRG